MVDDRQKFIFRLKELMRDYGEMSPTDLSRASQCDLHSVAKWLNGTFYPRFTTFLTLSNFFETTIDFILGRTDNESSFRIDIPIPFSIRLAKLLEDQHLSRYALSKKLGIKTTTISSWFKQTNMPETTNLIKLSNVFDVSIEYLVGLSNHEYI